MKFSNTALKFIVAFEALSAMNVRSGVCAQSVVVDRTSENNGDSIGRFSPNGINNLRVVVDPVTGDDESSSTTGTMHHTVADAAVSDVLLGTLPDGSGSRFSPSGIHDVVDPVTRGAESSSKTGTMHHTVADATVSDVLLETLPADGSGSRFSPSGIHHVVVDPVTRGGGSSSKTGTMHHTVADGTASNFKLGTLPADSFGRFSSSGINNLRRTVVDPVTRGDGSSSKTGTMRHTVADGTASDFKLGTLPADSFGRSSSSGINNLRRTIVDPVTRGDGSSSKTGTMRHTVASDVLLGTLPVDSGGRFSSTSMDTLAWDDVQQSKPDRSAASDGSLVPPSDIGNHQAVVHAFRKTIEDLEARLARAESALEYYVLSRADGGDENLKDHKDGLPQRHRKLSKKIGSSDPPIPVPPPLDGASDEIEGVYMYTNKCNNVFQVTIDCDRFGEEDPDLCSYSEFSRGTLVETPEQGSEFLPGREGLSFRPNPAIPMNGIIDPDIVCEFSGTFRRSSLVVEEEVGSNQLKLQALPLASSNGCETSTTNLQLVVKGTMKKADDDNETTILELEFSNDYGFTYYTDNKECPRSYIGQKVDEGDDNGQRALWFNDIYDKYFSVPTVSFCGSACGSPSIKVPTLAPTTKQVPTLAPTTKQRPASCEEEDNACLRATVADLEDRLRLCLPVDCVDGFERDTDLSCDKACAGECCAGKNACLHFTGHVHRDGSCTGEATCYGATIDEVKGSCTGRSACAYATIDEVKGSCTGNAACLRATIDQVTGSCTGKGACRRGKFGLVTESCNQDRICRWSIVYLLERSCNSFDDKDCRFIIAPYIVDNNKTPNPPLEVNCFDECGHLKDRNEEINECMNKCQRVSL